MFDSLISMISGKYDAFTIEEFENKIVYTLVSNDRSDFEHIKNRLKERVGKSICLNSLDRYEIEVIDELGFNKIVFKKIL